MNHHTISVQKTGHYFTLGQPGPQVREFWVVCHGYAQTAEAFLENFRLLDDGTRLVVAPEGFNSFYRKGFSGEVVCNWMTKRFRESEILDYSNFLQTLYSQYVAQLSPEVRIVFLGFSQGSATVCRWVFEKQPKFKDLLLWAGLPPEDLDYRSLKNYLADKNLYLLYGTSDPFLTPDRMAVVSEIETKNGVDFDERQFSGGHEIPNDVLREFLNKLN